MKVKVIGIEDVDYISKRTNQRVNGKRIHYVYDIDEKKGFGQKAENSYVSAVICNGLAVGDCIELFYNRFGSVSDIRLA